MSIATLKNNHKLNILIKFLVMKLFHLMEHDVTLVMSGQNNLMRSLKRTPYTG